MEPFAIPATSGDVGVLGRELAARHIDDVTPAGGLEPRPTLGHHSIEDGPDTPRCAGLKRNLKRAKTSPDVLCDLSAPVVRRVLLATCRPQGLGLRCHVGEKTETTTSQPGC